MPIINGRVHLEKQTMSTRHKVAYGAGIVAAVIVVLVAWLLSISTQVHGFFDGAKKSAVDVSTSVAKAQANAKAEQPTVPTPAAPPPPSDFAPALHAVLQTK